MDNASQFFEGLYSRFLMRDILSKVIPGFATLLYFANQVDPRFIEYVIAKFSFIHYVVMYGISFAFGTLLQYVGEKLRIININVWPKRRIFQKENNKESLRRLHVFFDRTKTRPEVRAGRERLAILKHISGIYAVCILAITFGNFILGSLNAFEIPSLPVSVLLLALAVTLISQNWHHGEEERIWEEFYTSAKPKKLKRT